MKPDRATAQIRALSLDEKIAKACETITPLWPLDRFIAVNPFHAWNSTPFPETAEKLRQLYGASLFMPASYYRAAWDKGLIRTKHIEAAIDELDVTSSVEDCLRIPDSRHQSPTPPTPRPMLSDILDSERDLQHEPAWNEVILRQISRFCAAWFDDSQSDWRFHRSTDLYADWKSSLRHEHGITLLMHDGGILKRSEQLPDNPRELIRDLLDELGLQEEKEIDLLISTLLRINGWASWSAYQRWQERLHGRNDSAIEELLAIRLAWERLLDDGQRGPASAWQRWKGAWMHPKPENYSAVVPYVWQRALEFAYQNRLGEELCRNISCGRLQSPSAQMAFCIDVRSETIRRAIETTDPDIQTLGFAGFFGLPISYRPLGTQGERPQLPGLFKPQYLVSDSTGDAPGDKFVAEQVEKRLSRRAQARPFLKMPASSFTLVEALGFAYIPKILARTLSCVSHRAHDVKRDKRLRPVFLDTLPLEQKAALVAGILKAMSLTTDFASLVVLVGHGSKTINNPHAAGLDCGACGGQTGEVNVRLLASLLNDAHLRRALRDQDLYIPDATLFLPALHNTTTDEIQILDRDDVVESHRERVARLEKTLNNAGNLAREERAHSLGLGKLTGRPKRLLKATRKRASDWSQTRPEWGLANNAAFIAAPRKRTIGIDLQGRVFLHDYDPALDGAGEILESIMTGPMIVATWINMQYYASTVDNKRYGSGNKVLHNVVGGNIGVFEGNGGDLRTGLAMQSLHDGQQWIHTPQRLSIYLEAAASPIERVIHRHPLVGNLVGNDWVFLFRIDPKTSRIERYCKGAWSLTHSPTLLN